MNPRGGLSPPTRLAGEHLRPLGQPSGIGVYERSGHRPLSDGYLRRRDAGRGARAHRRAVDARARAVVPRRRRSGARRSEISRVPDDELRRLADAGGSPTSPASATRPRPSSPRRCNGETPAYLAKLLGDIPEPGTDAGEALRAQLKGDLHSHSDWSDGGDTIAAMAGQGARPRPRVLRAHRSLAAPQDRERALAPIGCASSSRSSTQLNDELAPFRILTGIEVDILDDGALDQHEELLAASRRRRRERALEAAHGRRRDDAAHGRRGREPARRRARALHRPAARRPGGAARSRRSTRTSIDRGVPAVRHRARGQLPSRTARPAEADPHQGGRGRACGSRSAPTRTRPSNSSGSPTAPTAPAACGVTGGSGRQRDAGRRAARVVRLASRRRDDAAVRRGALRLPRHALRRRGRPDVDPQLGGEHRPRRSPTTRSPTILERLDETLDARPDLPAALDRCDTSLDVHREAQPRVVRGGRARRRARARDLGARRRRSRRELPVPDTAPVMRALHEHGHADRGRQRHPLRHPRSLPAPRARRYVDAYVLSFEHGMPEARRRDVHAGARRARASPPTGR